MRTARADSGGSGAPRGALDRRTFTATLLGLPLLAAGCGGGPDHGRITVGTGPAGTLYNQIGVALTTVTQRELGVRSTARPYTGSSVYLPHIHRGQLGYGINLAVDVSSAFGGLPPYGAAMNSLRSAMLITRAPFQYYVRGDSGIRTLADLRGRSVVTTFRSLATFEQVNAAALATAGLTFDDVRRVTVAGVPDAIRALVEGRAAAAGTVLGIPALREAHATLSGGIRVLDLGENEDALGAVAGMAAVTLEPGPAYVGIDRPTRVAQFDVYLNTSTNVPPERVYEVVGTVHRHWSDLQQAMPALARTAADELAPTRAVVPYHDGAVGYFRDAGMWTDAHEAMQRRLLDTL